MLILLRSRLFANRPSISPLRLSSRDFSTITSANGVPVPSPLLATTAQKGCNLMVDFLISSLGFSRDEAVSVSSKVSHLKSTHNPQLIINLFQQVGGLDQTQIKDIVFSVPRILRQRPEATLEPKIRALRDLGLSDSDLVRLIKRKGGNGLDKDIISSISYLRRVLGGSDHKVVNVINRDAWLVGSNISKIMAPNFVLFRNYGFSDHQIEKLIVWQPRICMQKLERLQDVLHRVEGELGIPRESKAFFYGFVVLCGNSKTTIDKKFGVFRSFGWSDADIFALVRTQPSLLTYSESAIRQKLKFLIQELEYTPAYVASCSAIFTYSLEKRVKPRNEVLKILKEHKLIKSKLALSTIIIYTEEKFMKLFVLPYTDEVPNLYETYMKNHKQLEAS